MTTMTRATLSRGQDGELLTKLAIVAHWFCLQGSQAVLEPKTTMKYFLISVSFRIKMRLSSIIQKDISLIVFWDQFSFLGDDSMLTGFVNDWIFLEELQAVNVIDQTLEGWYLD